MYIDSRVTATWKTVIVRGPKSVTKARFSNIIVISVFLGVGQHVLLCRQAETFCTSPLFRQCGFIRGLKVPDVLITDLTLINSE